MVLNEKVMLVQEEYHLCSFDPALWLDQDTVLEVIKDIQGDIGLLDFWAEKPQGNGPWSWPLRILTPGQVSILKKKYWKIKNVQTFFSQDSSPRSFSLPYNYLKNQKLMYLYGPSDKETKTSFFIDTFKEILEFFRVIQEYFGRYLIFDVDGNKIFIASTEGPFGSYTLAYDFLGKKGCRNYSCVLKSPVFPLNSQEINEIFKVELIVYDLTSEVTDIILYDSNDRVIGRLNEEGEFETEVVK